LQDAYRASGFSLIFTIMLAYLPTNEWMTSSGEMKLSGGPEWVRTAPYDIYAKVAPEDLPAWQNQGPDQKLLQAMLQAMLRDRCKLIMRKITNPREVYALEIAKSGAKLKPAKVDEPLPPKIVNRPGGAMMIGLHGRTGENQKVTFYKTSMESFAADLSGLVHDIVIDKTGLQGIYDFDLAKRNEAHEPDDLTPSVQPIWDLDALGLKLVHTTVPVDSWVIDHIERPSEN